MIWYLVYFNKTSKFTDFGFWALFALKQLAVAHIHYHNAGYYSLFFVTALVFASSALPQYEHVFVHLSGTIFTVEKR
jgi:hypothetical protein